MPQAGTGLCALCVRSLTLRLPLFLCPNRPKSLPARPPRRASPLDLNHEKQKTQRLTHLETLRRLSHSPAAPVHHGPRGLFASPAPLPTGREGAAAVFDSVAGAQYTTFRWAGARGGAPAGGARRFPLGGTEQSGARGGGEAARRDSSREAESNREPGRREGWGYWGRGGS